LIGRTKLKLSYLIFIFVLYDFQSKSNIKNTTETLKMRINEIKNKKKRFNINCISQLKYLIKGDFMGFEHTNKKGVKYWLHAKGRLMFFSKDPKDSIDLPSNMTIVENERTGLPMVKKKVA